MNLNEKLKQALQDIQALIEKYPEYNINIIVEGK